MSDFNTSGFRYFTNNKTTYTHEVSMGNIDGHSLWNKFGYNSDIDIGTEVVAEGFGGTFTRMTSADTVTLVSDNAADDVGSTGATGFVIYGIDGNRNEIIDVVYPDGITPVVSNLQFLGINRVSVYTAGSAESNVGNITVTATTAGSIQGYMPAGQGTTQQAIFHVPADETFLTEWMYINVNKISGGASPRVTIKGWVYSDVSGAKYEVFRETVDTNVENTVEVNPKHPFVIGEKSILWFEATTDTNNTVASIRFSGILRPNV